LTSFINSFFNVSALPTASLVFRFYRIYIINMMQYLKEIEKVDK